MNDFQNKFKRQIEILGFCLAKHIDCNIDFLQNTYGVEELTLRRDLRELRSNGIDIHSSGRKGIELSGKLGHEKLIELLVQYIAVCYSQNSYDKPVAMMVRKRKSEALSSVVILQSCIENNRMASVYYEKETDEVIEKKWYEVAPLRIFESDNYWRVLAVHEGIIKQFHLNKIIEIKPTGKKFTSIPKKQLDEMFLYSWKSWLGNEKIEVVLELTKKWVSQILPKQIMVNQNIVEKPGGLYELRLTVNNLDEIAGWIVSRGAGVKVIEPMELRDMVISLAKGALGNYN